MAALTGFHVVQVGSDFDFVVNYLAHFSIVVFDGISFDCYSVAFGFVAESIVGVHLCRAMLQTLWLVLRLRPPALRYIHESSWQFGKPIWEAEKKNIQNNQLIFVNFHSCIHSFFQCSCSLPVPWL